MTKWSDIGTTLRAARESRGSSIHDVAHYTRIPVKALHELEEGDYSSFPSQAYAKGFLAQYSAHLEVDATDWLDEFEGEETPLDLKNYKFLNDQEDELPPLPSYPSREQRRPERKLTTRVPSSAMQPLAVFIATSMLLSAGVYGFIKLNERFSAANAEEAPALQPAPAAAPLVVEGPRTEKPSRSVSNQGGPAVVAPPLAAHNPPPKETIPSVIRSEEISLPATDTKPPRAVIVEE